MPFQADLSTALIGVAIIVCASLGWFAYEARTAPLVADQESWDQHVDEAVALAELPLYDRIAHDQAANVDAEWQTVATSGWAAQ